MNGRRPLFLVDDPLEEQVALHAPERLRGGVPHAEADARHELVLAVLGHSGVEPACRHVGDLCSGLEIGVAAAGRQREEAGDQEENSTTHKNYSKCGIRIADREKDCGIRIPECGMWIELGVSGPDVRVPFRPRTPQSEIRISLVFFDFDTLPHLSLVDIPFRYASRSEPFARNRTVVTSYGSPG